MLQDLTDAGGSKKARLTRQLIGAAKRGDLTAIDLTLARGAKIDGRNWHGSTALMGTARTGQVAAIRHLLSLGASIDTCNVQGTTPLMLAAANGHNAAVQALVDAGANIKFGGYRSALFAAAQYGHPSTCSLLLKLGRAIDRTPKFDLYGSLLIAVQKGHADVVRILLDDGIDPNHYGRYGSPALAFCRSVKVAELLLHRGADPNLITHFGSTPLIIAVEHGYVDLVRLYLKHGVNVNFVNAAGRTALTSARYSNVAEIVNMLKQAGATK